MKKISEVLFVITFAHSMHIYLGLTRSGSNTPFAMWQPNNLIELVAYVHFFS